LLVEPRLAAADLVAPISAALVLASPSAAAPNRGFSLPDQSPAPISTRPPTLSGIVEIDDEWQAGKRYFSQESMRKLYDTAALASPTSLSLRLAPVFAPIH
jgi:hypothetical protein